MGSAAEEHKEDAESRVHTAKGREHGVEEIYVIEANNETKTS